MTEPMRFTFPLPPNLANGRMHWRTLTRKKTAYNADCDVLQLHELPPPPAQPFARATIAVTLTVGAQMDHDNAVARCKWPIDWLVTRGYLVDDKPKHLSWTGFPLQRVRRSEHGVDITLTPLLSPAPPVWRTREMSEPHTLTARAEQGGT